MTSSLMSLAQGDVRLIDTDVAQQLLTSKELARLAYVAADGTPRLMAMQFHWDGTELVMATFAGARKIAELRARPTVTVNIETVTNPPAVLQIRGTAEVTDVDGIVPEYALSWERYAGPEQAAATIAELDQPGVRMARIAVRPTWVGVTDFQTRFPGGATPEEFRNRGRI
jgi:PPOX class probable F420-dependent enzyme